MTVAGQVTFVPSWYLVSYAGQLSLAVPSWVGKMSTGDVTTTAGEENSEFCVIVGPVIGNALST